MLSHSLRVFLIGFLISGAGTIRGHGQNPAFPEYAYAIWDSDVIVVASLKKQESEDWNVEAYEIVPSETLKGKLGSDNVIRFRTNLDSTQGPPPSIEAGREYLLFLKANDGISRINEGSPYVLFENWQGIVPVAPGATESRSAKIAMTRYGIDVTENIKGFKEAILSVLSKKPIAEMSEEGRKVISALKLDRED